MLLPIDTKSLDCQKKRQLHNRFKAMPKTLTLRDFCNEEDRTESTPKSYKCLPSQEEFDKRFRATTNKLRAEFKTLRAGNTWYYGFITLVQDDFGVDKLVVEVTPVQLQVNPVRIMYQAI